MKKKIIALVIALCLCIGILASCGTGSDKAKAEVMNEFNLFGNDGDYTKDNFAYTTANKIELGDDIQISGWLANLYKFPIQTVRKLVDGNYKYGVYSFKDARVVVPVEYDQITLNDGFVIARKTTVENPGTPEEAEVNTYTLFDRTFTAAKTSVDKPINLEVNFIGSTEYAFVRIEGNMTVYTVGTDGKLTLKEEMSSAPQTNDTIGAAGFEKINMLYILGKDFDGYYTVRVGNTQQLFKGEKLIGSFDFPGNIIFETNIGGSMIYQTRDAVDENAKYTYSDGATRFLVRTFILDIKSVKVREVKTDALFTGEEKLLFAKDGSKIIAAVITARKIDNYILQDEKTYLLSEDATIGNQIIGIDLDNDMVKLKDNRYLVYQPDNGEDPQERMLIVDKDLNIIVNLSGMYVDEVYGQYVAILLDSGEYVLIDADGKVIIGQDKGYTQIGNIVNGKAFVIRPNATNPAEDDFGIVDIATGNFTPIAYDKDNENIDYNNGIMSFCYIIERADGTRDFFSVANGQKLFTLEAGEGINDWEYTSDFMILLTNTGNIYKLTPSAAA